MIAAVRRGDRVVTGGGILGTVQRVPMVQDKDGKQVPSQEIEVEIAKDIRVTVLRDTITSVLKPVAANDAKPAKDKASCHLPWRPRTVICQALQSRVSSCANMNGGSTMNDLQ